MKLKALLVAAFAGLALFPAPAAPYIEAMYPLEQIMKESEVIVEGVIEKVDLKNKLAIIRTGKALKGKCNHPQVRMNISGGQYWHPDAVMQHMVVGAPSVVFYNGELQGMAFINRFFIQLYGDKNAPPATAWWNMTHVEIRCNRTFNGTPSELSKLVTGIIGGKIKAPPPDARIPVITKVHMLTLPPPGRPVSESQMPLAFRKPGPFKPRMADTPAKTNPGVKFESFAVTGREMPDFAKLAGGDKGVAEKIDLSKRKQEKNIAFRFSGFIQVPKDATYIFTVASAGGNRLAIGPAEVVTKIGFLEANIEIAGGIDLKAGKHAFMLTFFDAGQGQDLKLFWQGPEIEKQEVPASAFLHSL